MAKGALAANNLSGFTTALAQSLRGAAIGQQLLQCIPCVSTIAAMAFYNACAKARARRQA